MLKFSYNFKKDAKNWVDTIKDVNPSWGINYDNETIMVPQNIKRKIIKRNNKEAIELVVKYLKNQPRFKRKKEVIDSEMKAIRSLWKKKENDFFSVVEKMTKRPMFNLDFIAYFTTMFICPYDTEDYKWFMLSMWHSLPFQVTIICHEIFHFQFLYYYSNFCKQHGLNETQLENLKESLTVLLNTEEFNDIILCRDEGYSHHRITREKIIKNWEENKNRYLRSGNGFEIFLREAIKYI